MQPLQEQSALAKAQAAEARFRGLLESAPDAMVIVNRDGRIALVNARTVEMFGYARDELIGQPVEVLLPERYRRAHVHHRTDYGVAPHARSMGADLELFAVRRDGSEFPVEVSLSPFGHDDDALVMSAVRDITDRKRAEAELRRARIEAESANSAKSEFLSRMSHELRTPLNAVLGFAQLLEMDVSDQQLRNVQRILRAGRHLLELINEVLEISRIEAGKLTLSPEPVPVRDAFREAVDLVRPLAEDRHIDLRIITDAHAPRYITADRQRFAQVLLNLLSNAVKYNDDGGSVTISHRETPNGRVRVAVQDTGPGIAPEDQLRLFAPFERLGADTTSVEGTGLGLALSKALIEAMGGTIGVESELGNGSTFFVEMAAAEGPIERQRRISGDLTPASESGATTAHKLVLYIEDNLPNLELIEQVFERWPGVRLISAIQGRLGIDLAQKHQPDLILLDVHLPDMTGNDVLRVLREDARTRRIPIIVISADATRGQIERLRAAGALAYLTKPLDLPQFIEVVGKVLESDG
jgi:PAS domain S-box-containing protein